MNAGNSTRAHASCRPADPTRLPSGSWTKNWRGLARPGFHSKPGGPSTASGGPPPHQSHGQSTLPDTNGLLGRLSVLPATGSCRRRAARRVALEKVELNRYAILAVIRLSSRGNSISPPTPVGLTESLCPDNWSLHGYDQSTEPHTDASRADRRCRPAGRARVGIAGSRLAR